MRLALLCLLLTGCAAKKPYPLDTSVKYRIYVFTKTCKAQPDGAPICKARFDPQEIRVKP